MDGDVEQTMRNKLYEHDFLESGSKPGLFFRKVGEDTMLFCDFRKNGTPKFYGFVGKSDPLPKEVVDKFTARVRQALSSIGCSELEVFDGKTPEEAKAALNKACEKCFSMNWLDCPHCGEKVCRQCGGAIVDREEEAKTDDEFY